MSKVRNVKEYRTVLSRFCTRNNIDYRSMLECLSHLVWPPEKHHRISTFSTEALELLNYEEDREHTDYTEETLTRNWQEVLDVMS